MKHLSDTDIMNMANAEFTPDVRDEHRRVCAKLRLNERIRAPKNIPQTHATLDLHQHTEEQAWNEIMLLAQSGVRRATIITGASGILKIKFQQWAHDSILSPYIISISPINNGSFDVRFHKQPVSH